MSSDVHCFWRYITSILTAHSYNSSYVCSVSFFCRWSQDFVFIFVFCQISLVWFYLCISCLEFPKFLESINSWLLPNFGNFWAYLSACLYLSCSLFPFLLGFQLHICVIAWISSHKSLRICYRWPQKNATKSLFLFSFTLEDTGHIEVQWPVQVWQLSDEWKFKTNPFIINQYVKLKSIQPYWY